MNTSQRMRMHENDAKELMANKAGTVVNSMEGVVRYIVFCGKQYYPSGGARDYYASATDIETAKDAARSALDRKAVIEIADWSDDRGDDITHDIEWAHVMDVNTGEIVHREGCNPYGCDKELYC